MVVFGLQKLPFYAYHGVHPEERTLGGRFEVSVTCRLANPSVGTEDTLDETLDYAAAYRLIESEMATPRNLLETLARRIGEGILALDDRLDWVIVYVEKLNPPLGGPGGTAYAEYKADRPTNEHPTP